jgi:hypothetical protein
MRRFLSGALAACICVFGMASAAQAQSSAREYMEQLLRNSNLTSSQMARIRWDEEVIPIDNTGFRGLEISRAFASGGGVSTEGYLLINRTSKPYCVVPIIRYSASGKINFIARDAGILEGYRSAPLASSTGALDGSTVRFVHGIAYWPARTDVTTGRCWGHAPAGVKDWQAANQPVYFYGSVP